MGDGQRDGVDTREMVAVHTAFRRELGLAPGLVRGTPVAGVRRARTVAGHVQLMTTLVRLHHAAEDRVLWPPLLERVPGELAAIVALMETQHERIQGQLDSVEDLLRSWTAEAGSGDREDLAQGIERLCDAMGEHLAAEEELLLPLASRYLTDAEWDRFGEEAIRDLPRSKGPLAFGMVMYEGDAEVIAAVLAKAPVLLRLLVPTLAPGAYRRYARRVHGTPTPAPRGR